MLCYNDVLYFLFFSFSFQFPLPLPLPLPIFFWPASQLKSFDIQQQWSESLLSSCLQYTAFVFSWMNMPSYWVTFSYGKNVILKSDSILQFCYEFCFFGYLRPVCFAVEWCCNVLRLVLWWNLQCLYRAQSSRQ